MTGKGVTGVSLGGSMIALSLATTLLLPLPALAELYRWTDASGDLHFTDDATTIPKIYRDAVVVEADIGGNPAVEQEIDYRKTVETLERKHAGMPPGQVLSEDDVRALLEARKKLGR